MKRNSYLIFLSAVILLAAGIFYSFRATDRVVVDAVDVDIEFGRGPDCSNRGTCSITESSGNSRESELPEGSGKLYFDASGHLVLEIAKSSLKDGIMAEQFAENLFEFDKDLNLPAEIFGKLNQPQRSRTHAKIKAGKYKVVEEAEYFKITIK